MFLLFSIPYLGDEGDDGDFATGDRRYIKDFVAENPGKTLETWRLENRDDTGDLMARGA